MADTFLIVFQRNLFSLVHSWAGFFEFSAYSFIFELVTFFYGVTESYQKLHDAVIDRGRQFIDKPDDRNALGFLAWFYGITHGFQDGNFFVNKSCLYISYRFVLRFSTMISYMLFEVFLRYGYNSYFYDAATYTEDEFKMLMAFQIISMVLEFIAIIPTDWLIRKRSGKSMTTRFFAFFSDKDSQMYVTFFVWVLTHISTDVFVDKINYSASHLFWYGSVECSNLMNKNCK